MEPENQTSVGYKSLPFFQQAEIIYDFTVGFVSQYINKYSRTTDKIYLQPAEEAANVMVCLINQTNRLLDQKLRWIEEKFINEGGYSENLLKKRLKKRNKQ